MSQRQFGLIGKNIHYSFSKKYFTKKFALENLTDCIYENFDINSIEEFPQIIASNPNLKGLNVTIPYKKNILKQLDKISKKANTIGAVNVIKIIKIESNSNKKKNKTILKGYNSDYYGFKKSLKPLLQTHHKKALILGTGGSAKAVSFALTKLGIPSVFVSRNPKEDAINYDQLNILTFDTYQIIINCTPLGTSPNITEFPQIPYNFLTDKHIAFDLIYNPEETEFLKRAKKNGAVTKNGYEMLLFQAEKAWQIWNKK